MLFATAAMLPVALIATAPAKIVVQPPLPVPLNPVVAANRQSCDKLLPSGLGYRQLKAGTGAKPSPTDFVAVAYLGYLRSNGAVFDQRSQGVFQLTGVVAGFAEGILQMNKGAIFRLCIPAKLGYGAQDQETIPANSDLGFQVELLDFKTAADVAAMRAAEAVPAVKDAPPQ
jgi:FKBP-type peptidyl-prolyl cis-trans isomerase FkpA